MHESGKTFSLLLPLFPSPTFTSQCVKTGTQGLSVTKCLYSAWHKKAWTLTCGLYCSITVFLKIYQSTCQWMNYQSMLNHDSVYSHESSTTGIKLLEYKMQFYQALTAEVSSFCYDIWTIMGDGQSGFHAHLVTLAFSEDPATTAVAYQLFS